MTTGSLDRHKLLLPRLLWLTILFIPLLLNLNVLLKLTKGGSAGDRVDIDMDHPSSFEYDVGNNTTRQMIECTWFNRTSKKTYTAAVTAEDFYADRRQCGHSFKADTVAFHVGKGGGGTLQKHLGLSVIWVHPRPNQKINEQLRQGPLRTLIFNVRDPIDRFVSAFNWRVIILCHPNDERYRGRKKKGRKGKIGATRRPDEFCKEGYEEEEILLRETYQLNPNVLAEALCDESSLQRRAKEDFLNIHHNTTLTQWLDFLIEPDLANNITDDGINEFMVLPVEKRYGANETRFERHIENARWHLLNNRYGADAVKEMMQLSQQKEEKRRRKMKKNEAHLHSSSKFINSTKPMLTALGECCLARHLIDDYRLIQSMLGTGNTESSHFTDAGLDPLNGAHSVIQMACSWGDEQQQESCRGDLISMLSRRAKYFDTSKGSCSTIASTE